MNERVGRSGRICPNLRYHLSVYLEGLIKKKSYTVSQIIVSVQAEIRKGHPRIQALSFTALAILLGNNRSLFQIYETHKKILGTVQGF